MKVSYNWLKEFVNIDVSAQEIADRLTVSGFEVEDLVYMNEHLHDVYVGKILKIEKHPEADKLVVCQVDVGFKNVQIITSATNVFEGAHVPVSLDGANLANGIQIKPSKLRGVDSDGMFCSGEELGIDENYIEGGSFNGILILPESMKPGTKIEDALMLNDVVLDINVTPNRPDCNSVVGIARELCAMYGKTFKEPDLSFKCVAGDVKDYVSGVEVGMDTNARKNRGGHTMEWLISDAIEAAGFKPGRIARNASGVFDAEVYLSYLSEEFPHLALDPIAGEDNADKRFDFVVKLVF